MICVHCMVSPALKKFVIGHGHSDLCDYCGKTDLSVEDSKLMECIKALFHTVLVPFGHLPQMTQASFECGADLAILDIWNHLEYHPPTDAEEFNQKLCDYLESEFIDKHANWPRKDLFMINYGDDTHNEFEAGWENFISSVAHGHRFFNRQAKSFLDDLFHILTDDYNLEKKGIIQTIDSNVPIFRARIAASIDILNKIQDAPESELGPTPRQLASDQRMSPAGISVFYGALDRQTCISEIRPLVGDSAVSGEFRTLTKLRLIDLNKLSSCNFKNDIYDDEFVRHAHAVAFFKEMAFQMSRPARRGNSNPYLATQVIFEYLRVKFKDNADGVIYQSVQQGQSGACLALFPESSLISPISACSIQDDDVFAFEKEPLYSLFYVPESLRYHRVRGVSYMQEEDDSDFKLTSGINLQKYMGTRF